MGWTVIKPLNSATQREVLAAVKFLHRWLLRHKKLFSRYLSSKSENIRMPCIRWPWFQRFISTIIIARYVCKAFIPLLLYRFCFKFTWRADGRRECSLFFYLKCITVEEQDDETTTQNPSDEHLFFPLWNWDFRSDVVTKTRNHAKPPKTTNKTSQNHLQNQQNQPKRPKTSHNIP